MHEAFRAPIGLQLSQAARTVSRAFDEALDGAGGTLPVWLTAAPQTAAPQTAAPLTAAPLTAARPGQASPSSAGSS